MIGYDFYRIHEPLRLHFLTIYDLFKYKGKVKYGMSRDKFETRRDKLSFEKIAAKIHSPKTAGLVCIANFVYNINGWLYNNTTEILEVYNRWQGIKTELTTLVINDVNKLVSTAEENDVSPKQMFERTPSGKYPPALQMLIHGKIQKETISILAGYNEFFINWMSDYEIDPFISDQLFILKKYQPFLITKGNTSKYHEIASRIF